MKQPHPFDTKAETFISTVTKPLIQNVETHEWLTWTNLSLCSVIDVDWEVKWLQCLTIYTNMHLYQRICSVTIAVDIVCPYLQWEIVQ